METFSEGNRLGAALAPGTPSKQMRALNRDTLLIIYAALKATIFSVTLCSITEHHLQSLLGNQHHFK